MILPKRRERLVRWLLRSGLNVRMAFASLASHPGRTALTLVGIVIGIVALVVMMALTQALKTSVYEAGRPLGSNTFQVQREPRFIRSSAGWMQKRRKPFTLDDIRTLEIRLTHVTAIGGEMWAMGQRIKTAQRETNPLFSVAGGMPAFLEANGYTLAAGRFVTDEDIHSERALAVVGWDIVDTLFRGRLEETLGSTIRLMGHEFEIVGVMGKQPTLFGAAWRNAFVVIPVSTFKNWFGFRSLHMTLTVSYAEELAAAEDEAAAVIRWMRGVRPGDPDDFDMFSNESMSEELDQLALVLGAASAGICLLALLVGGIGVMNIMLVSVTERTREIGIRKALGARPATILGQFVTEAIAIAVLGGATGVALAVGAVMIVQKAFELPAVVPFWAVLVALASSALVGIVAGIYPAARAARLNPIDALRYE